VAISRHSIHIILTRYVVLDFAVLSSKLTDFGIKWIMLYYSCTSIM